MKKSYTIQAILYVVFVCCFTSTSMAQFPEGPIGIFEGFAKTGLGEGNIQEITFNNGEYTITQEGPNMSNGTVYLYLDGSFRLIADVKVEDIDEPTPGSFLGNAALGIANFLDYSPASKFFFFGLRTDGSIEISYKQNTGTYFTGYGLNRILSSEHHTGELEIMRNDNSFEAYYTEKTTGNRKLLQKQTIIFGNTVVVALSVSSQESGKYTKGTFSNVRLIPESLSSSENWELHK